MELIQRHGDRHRLTVNETYERRPRMLSLAVGDLFGIHEAVAAAGFQSYELQHSRCVSVVTVAFGDHRSTALPGVQWPRATLRTFPCTWPFRFRVSGE